MMQAAMQMMGGANMGGGMPNPDGSANPGSGAPPMPMFNPAMMQAAMQMMGGANMGGGMPNPADARPVEERYANQLDQLANMGFPDKHSNLQALQTAGGDVNQAINSLLGGA